MESTGSENSINAELEFASLAESVQSEDFIGHEDESTRDTLNLVFFDAEEEVTETDRLRWLLYGLVDHSSTEAIVNLAAKDKRIFTLLKHMKIEHLNCADIYGINEEFLSKIDKIVQLIESIKPKWK